MTQLRAFFASRLGRLVLHDAALAAGTGVAAWQAAGESWQWGAIVAAAVVAGKAFLRLILPVPAVGSVGTPAVPVAVAVPVVTVVTPEQRKPGQRLGRHQEHDERSRAYAITPKPRHTLISVRHTRHGSVLNQGDLGSCTGNAGTGAMMTDPFPGRRLTETFAKQLYSDATKADNVPGIWPPTDTGSSGLAVAKVLHRRGLITGYQHCFSPDAVYTALQDGPVLVGVAWLEGFDNPTPDGQMVYSGNVRGGHELCMDEIDVANQRVWVTNSWGHAWALKGRAWWSFDDFTKVMAAQGDAVVPRR